MPNITKDKKFNLSQSMLANFSLLFVAIIWGASYSITKETLCFVTVPFLIFCRFLISTLILLPVCMKYLIKTTKYDFFNCLILGVILSCIFLFETLGISKTTAINSAFLISICIIITPIIDSFMTKILPGRYIILCCVSALFGTGLLVYKSQKISFNPGDIYILCAATLRGFMVVFTKRIIKNRDISSLSLTFLQMLTVSILSGFVVAFSDGLSGFVPPKNYAFWCGLLFLTLCCTLAAFFIQNWAVRISNPTRVGFLMGTEPVFGAIFAFFLVGEHLTKLNILGAAIILFATYMGAKLSSKEQKILEEDTHKIID